MSTHGFEQSLIACLVAAGVAAVSFGQASKNYRWNDNNFFPIGIYEYPTNYDGTPASLETQEDHLAELLGSGFSLARIWHGSGGLTNNLNRIYYGTGIEGYGGGLATLVDIDTMAVQAARNGHDSAAEDDLRLKVINQGDNHPGTFAWHSMDEPGPGNLVGAATEQQLINELSFTTANLIGTGTCAYTPWDDSYLASSPLPDPLPVLVNLGVRVATSIMSPIDYGAVANSFSMEWYPNYQAYKTAPSAYPNTDRRLVGYYADQLQVFSAANDDCPTVMVLEAAGGLELGGSPPYPPPLNPNRIASRPNRTELRFDAYSSIIHGANGVLWYGLQFTNNPTMPGGGQLWEDIKNIARELGDSQTGAETNLKNALADNLTTSDFILGDSGLEGTLKLWNGTQYFIVANSSYSGGAGQTISNADLTLTNWLGGQLEVRVLFEGGRTIVTTDGRFQDSFDPWEVHVYESQAACLPNGPAVWTGLGNALAGTSGTPQLIGEGPIEGGTPMTLTTKNALPVSFAWLILGFSQIYLPILGGTLVPNPKFYFGPKATDGFGEFGLSFTWPTGLPAGICTYWQTWILDPSGPAGWTATNGLVGTSH